MPAKPLIGINADYRPANKKDSVPFTWINSGYYDSVSAAGGVPVVLPPLAEDADLKRLLGTLDGVVLTGCKLDLDPINLGLERHPSTRPMPPRREDFDRRLARLVRDQKLPALAIGAGMQTLNLLCGGTLFQHVPEDVLKALHHRDPVEACLRHVIEIVPETIMDRVYGPGEIRVNSDHHMAVDQIGPMFRVSATSMDGVVEAYESMDDDWWVLGVQFHPENQSASALDLQIFEAFIEGCLEQKGSMREEPAILSLENARRAA
ncbi:MAG: gamma-glutamyl-gamma-aminobutyrate hydrolase family protein [Planctomyces sp.]|nr:gamma-glutamyl-gamma-aminobutyrate hydrolase family protein [Planctomyces sp.]